MSAILNFGKWKKLYEETKSPSAAPAASNETYTGLTPIMIETGALAVDKAVQVPEYVNLGPIGGVSITDASQLKAGGTAIMKDPIVWTNKNKEGGTAYGVTAYRTDAKKSPTLNSDSVSFINFKFYQSTYGSTTITKITTRKNTMTAYFFIGAMLSHDGFEMTTEGIHPFYINKIKAVAALAPGLPNLAQSIEQYKTDYKEKKSDWETNLSSALLANKVLNGDAAAISKLVKTNSAKFSTIFG